MPRKQKSVAITWTLALVLVQFLSSTPALAAPVRRPNKPAHPLPPVKDTVTLGTIDGEADTKLTVINLRFDRKPQWKSLRELQDHGSFLQLILPDTIVPEPGKFIDGNSPFIPKIAVFQLTANDAGVRFFVNQDAAKTKEAANFEILDKRIVLTVDHDALKTSLAAAKVAQAKEAVQPSAHAVVEAAAPKVSQAADAAVAAEPGYEVATLQDALQVKSEVSAEEVIARTEVQRDIPAPAEIMKNEPAEKIADFPVKGSAAASFGPPRPDDDEAAFDALAKRDAAAKEPEAKASGLDFREKLVQMATFSGFMIVLLGIVLLLKPVLRKRAARKGGEADVIEMKTLASLPLAARQKLSLIQVGDEKILIGITPENVSFITTIGSSSMQQQQQRMPRQAFQGMLTDGRDAMLEMQQPPKLKDIPGNDEASLRARPMKSPAPAAVAAKPAAPAAKQVAPQRPAVQPSKAPAAAKPASTAVAAQSSAPTLSAARPAANAVAKKPAPSRINIAITDDGPKDLRAPQKDDAPASQKGIEDVTQLIREKLKNLRTI